MHGRHTEAARGARQVRASRGTSVLPIRAPGAHELSEVKGLLHVVVQWTRGETAKSGGRPHG